MRTALALAAAGALVALGSSSSSARPPQLAGPQANGEEATIQSVDWYCGPRCQSWHHRRWEERHTALRAQLVALEERVADAGSMSLVAVPVPREAPPVDVVARGGRRAVPLAHLGRRLRRG